MYTSYYRISLCAIITAGASSAALAQLAHDQDHIGHTDRWTAPRSHKLAQFASGIYAPQGQAVLQVIGDSINATNSVQGMQVGYRDRLAVPFNAWVVHADSGNSEIGYTNAQGALASNAIRIPGDYFSSGLRGISPVRARDAVWNGNVAWGGTMSDCYILNFRLSAMPLGNPFASGAIVDARMIMFEGQTQLAGFECSGMRGNSIVQTGLYSRPNPVAGSIIWIDRVAGSGTADAGVRMKSDAVTSESTPGENTQILLGTRFRARISDGVQMQFISHGGWNAVDHVDSTRFTDDALRQYYAATDPPTHIMLWIGQNQTVAESTNFYTHSYQVFKHDVEAIIDRHDRVITELGAPAPRWLVVSQYKTGYDQFHHELMCEGLYAVSQGRENVSFLNLYRLCNGEDFDQTVFLSDGVHPNNAGVLHLASLMNSEFQAALACVADFDRSGFIDLDDFTAFDAAFQAGDDTADVDDTGFVDTDDFTFFVSHFEQGC